MKFRFRSILPTVERGPSRARPVCAEATCNEKNTQADSSGRAGVRVGESWYCSPGCFEKGTRHLLAQLASDYVEGTPSQPRFSLGLALLSRGIVSEDQLRNASLKAQADGILLEEILLEQGCVNEKQLAAARGTQWGHPSLGIDIAQKPVEANLPLSLLRAHSAVPIHYSHEMKRVVLGFVHRVEHSLLHAIEQISGCRAEPCFITPSDFNLQSTRFNTLAGYEEVVSEHPADPLHIARSLVDFAGQMPDSEARFTRCKSWIWVRMTSEEGMVDAIFTLKPVTEGAEGRFSSLARKVTEALG
jgi:hypothetical protein